MHDGRVYIKDMIAREWEKEQRGTVSAVRPCRSAASPHAEAAFSFLFLFLFFPGHVRMATLDVDCI